MIFSDFASCQKIHFDDAHRQSRAHLQKGERGGDEDDEHQNHPEVKIGIVVATECVGNEAEDTADE